MPNKNMHTLDLSLRAAEKDGHPYLGDTSAIHDLIGKLASEALVRLVQISLGTMTVEEAGEHDLRGAQALARIFLGQEPGFNLVPGWNQPGAIDAFVAQESEIAETEPVARLATLFLLMIQDMYGAARLTDEGYPDDDVQTAIDGSLETVTAVLIGVSFDDLEAHGLDGAQGYLGRTLISLEPGN